jgi:chemotaxis protein CheX
MKRPSRRRPVPSALPAILDLNAAGPLANELLARRGSPVIVDGAAVERMGAQCLQVLLAARKTWEADGQSFQLTTPSSALTQALATFGAESLADPQVAEGSAS